MTSMMVAQTRNATRRRRSLGCSGSVNGALRDGSVDRINVDDGGANQKRDEDLHSDGGEEKRVSQPQAGSRGGDVEVGGCHGPIVMLHNVGKP
jgi:hypothetical protein